MMTLIAAALAAVAPAQAAPAHGSHQHGQSHPGQPQHGQSDHDQHKGMGCCEQAGKMDCCNDMADATKMKPCCSEHAKAKHKHQ